MKKEENEVKEGTVREGKPKMSEKRVPILFLDTLSDVGSLERRGVKWRNLACELEHD
ncbi:hypothetical protein QBE54_07955 [Thermatribacter velox]|uniref:Uncharacterized protein n=1 Tax=Thermatribacter velox TaxID=3039681 RepID=A0ABZ2YBA6_9BACT